MSDRLLGGVNLQTFYRTSSHKLGGDFLGKCLASSSVYRRAAAFFSSGVFLVATSDWFAFFRSGGRAFFVTSPHLSPDDIKALEEATYHRHVYVSDFSLDSYEEALTTERFDRFGFLRGLLATGRIDIRIAHRTGGNHQGIYHEKLGVFSDKQGNLLAFSGSANETRAAYVGNFERIDVFWTGNRSDRRRAFAIEEHFGDLWENKTEGVEVIHLVEAIQRNLLVARTTPPGVRKDEVVEESGEAEDKRTKSYPEVLIPASGVEIRDYQRAAIRAWARAGGRGILEMATGSGKTITALALASGLYDVQGPPLAILIVVPFIHLADQWREVAKLYGLDPIRCAEGTDRWFQSLSTAIDSLNCGRRPILSMVTTNATLQLETFRRLIARIRVTLLLVADEMHTLGASASFAALPDNATARLGLSATPDRAYDPAGSGRLTEYFGQTVFKYALEDALKDGILTPYRYFPLIVWLDDDEAEQYIDLTKRIVALGGSDDEDSPISEARKRLLIKRARLIATAKAKLPRLLELLGSRRSDTHILVYCGDGSVEGPDHGDLVRQIDEATSAIGNMLAMRCARYTADTPSRRRVELLDQFAAGEIQVLLAIRCLDEGVDVPATRQAFMLASSTNPRQFVQRRGRVLRKHAGKRRAELFDFFVTLSPSVFRIGHPEFEFARGLLRNQLSRVLEFSSLAENGPSARNKLLDLRTHFHLLAEG